MICIIMYLKQLQFYSALQFDNKFIILKPVQVGTSNGRLYLLYRSDESKIECLDLSSNTSPDTETDKVGGEPYHICGYVGGSERYIGYFATNAAYCVWDLGTRSTVRSLKIGQFYHLQFLQMIVQEYLF